MSTKNNILPIGKLLQNAGLISDEQLEIALVFQSQHTKMKLGEILALQEVIEVQTVDFFVNKWHEMKQEGKQFPIGYYLKQAYLLSGEQIKTILIEQKKNQLKFGELAVEKGWLKRETVDFFLNELTAKSSSLMSLISLEEYNRDFLHLEKKYANSSLMLSRILAWTGGDTSLTRSICNVFKDSNLNIPTGMEINGVDKLIESSIIRNWQTTKLGSYIRFIKDRLVNNQRCEPILLLSEYETILLSNGEEYKNLKEQKELLNLGIIVKDKKKLRVTNLIFQQVFNQNWIAQTRKILEAQIQQESSEIVKSKKAKIEIDNIKLNSIPQADTSQNKIDSLNNNQQKVELTEIITKFGSLLTLAGIVLLIPVVLVVNNYSSSLRQEKKLSVENLSQASKLKQFCRELNLVDSSSALGLISQIEKSKEEILRVFPYTLEVFPDNCEAALNELRVLAAPQLGRESRVIEALRNLCKIPADGNNINEAKIWIEHWSASPTWGQETKSYLNLINECPASEPG